MSLERFHPHAQQHSFPATDQIPPLTGTLRLYVDGTLGNDAASGQGGWANAWKTWNGRTIPALAWILMVSPSNLTIIVYVRGSFTEDVRLVLHGMGTSQVHIVHAIDDFATIRTGTISAVGGSTYDCGLERLTLLGAALDGTELGMTLCLDDPVGGSRATCTILRVDVTNQYVWVNQLVGEFPAWVATSPANARVVVPSCYIDGQFSIDMERGTSVATGGPPANLEPMSYLIGIRNAGYLAIRGSGVAVAGCYCRTTGGTWRNLYSSSTGMVLWVYQRTPPDYNLTDVLAAEFGLIKGPTPTAYNTLGNAGMSIEIVGSTRNYFSGWLSDRAGNQSESGIFDRFSAGYIYNLAPYGQFSAGISRGSSSSYGAIHCHHGSMRVNKISFLDLPVAGVNALFRCERTGASIDVADAAVDGVNEGTGSDLKVAWIKGGGLIFRSGFDAGLRSKHRQLVAEEGGGIVSRGAVTFGSNPGGGADAYAGSVGAFVEFQDNVTKSAVNSETAIQNGVDGQIVAAGTQFIAASAVFTAAHVGRSIKVSNSINPANNAVHLITAWTNATTVVLGASVGLVNEGPGLTWGLVGTPAPILEVARGGRVSQASGKTFNVRKPEVDPDTAVQEWNNYGYGPNGAIYEHENAEVTLGTLVEAAGAAGATGLAAKIKNGSKLVHSGGAVLLGVTPLDLGGNAVAAWPATTVNDAAAGTPQGCMVIANV